MDFLREAHRVLKPGYSRDSLLLIRVHIFRQIPHIYVRVTYLDKRNDGKMYIYASLYCIPMSQPKLLDCQVLIVLCDTVHLMIGVFSKLLKWPVV